MIRASLFKRFESSVYSFRESLRRMLKTHEMFLKALNSGIVPAGEDAETLLSKTGQMSENDILIELEKVTGTYNIKDLTLKN